MQKRYLIRFAVLIFLLQIPSQQEVKVMRQEFRYFGYTFPYGLADCAREVQNGEVNKGKHKDHWQCFTCGDRGGGGIWEGNISN